MKRGQLFTEYNINRPIMDELIKAGYIIANTSKRVHDYTVVNQWDASVWTNEYVKELKKARFKSTMHIAMQRNWQKESYRKTKSMQISKRNLKDWATPEYRQKQKKAHEGLWENEEFKQYHSQRTSEGTRKAYNERHDEIIEKIYQTKKANNSENSSDWEDREFEALQKKFSEVKHPYKCKRYPFKCDFYLPSLDLFIECHYFWTHMPSFGAFDENNKLHIKVLQWLQSRARESEFFQNAIDTWTIRDTKKLKTAEQNNLNYKVFYTVEDFYKWYDTIQGDI